MAIPARLIPLLEQLDFAAQRLLNRLAGPEVNSGDGLNIRVEAMTNDEYLWEPVPQCWSVRPRSAGPGPGATELVGAGDWGRDRAYPAPQPLLPSIQSDSAAGLDYFTAGACYLKTAC